MKKHDCTYKESLYSTYPYLTNSNKKSTLPVMTKQSTLGYREKIDILWFCIGIVAKSSVENSFPFNAWVCTLNRSPPKQTKQTNQSTTPHPSHNNSSSMMEESWKLSVIIVNTRTQEEDVGSPKEEVWSPLLAVFLICDPEWNEQDYYKEVFVHCDRHSKKYIKEYIAVNVS